MNATEADHAVDGPAPVAITGRRARALVALGFLVLIGFRIPWFGGPFSRDECVYMTVAHEILHGNLPFVTAWDQRQPLTYFVYLLAWVLPGDPDLRLDLFGLLFSIATAAGILAFLRRTRNGVAAIGGLFLFAILSADLSMQGQTANTEIVLGALLGWSAWFLSRAMARASARDAVLAGLLIGVGGAIKEIMVFPAIAAMIAVAISKEGLSERARILGRFVSGLALPWALTLAVYGVAGHLDLIVDTFVLNSHYASTAWKDLIAGPLLLARQPFALYGTWPLWILALLAFARGDWRILDRSLPRLLFIASIVMIVLPGKYFAHYYLLALPPVILCCVGFLDDLAAEKGCRAAAVPAAAALTFVGAIQLMFIFGHVPQVVRELNPVTARISSLRDVAKRIGSDVPDEASLLVYGWDSQLYYYSGLRPAQPLIHLGPLDQQFLGVTGPLAARFRSRAVDALRKHPADVVVIEFETGPDMPTPITAHLDEIIARHYESWNIADAEAMGTAGIETVWRRR